MDDRFVHIETLDDRSRPSQWTIRPHVHAAMNQVFHITAGSGVMRAETNRFEFTAPCLLIVPAGIVHGFTWEADSSGSVVTLATLYLQDLLRHDADLAPLFRAVRTIGLTAEADAEIGNQTGWLMRERGWAAPGHRAAADAGLLALLVTALRALDQPEQPAPGDPGHHAALVARLRQRIEERFRLREPVEVHAKTLGVSAGRLRAACARMTRQSPSRMLDERALLEAKRALLYSNMSIAEAGYAAGFADAAYFTRFFTRHVGKSPRAFRRDHAGDG